MSTVNKLREMIYTVSSPGKVLLFGEHAVVYGKAAIAMGMDLRTRATVYPCESDFVEIHFEDLDLFQMKWNLGELDLLCSSVTSDPQNPVSCSPAFQERTRGFLSPAVANMDNYQQSCCIFLFLYSHIVGSKRNSGGLKIVVQSDIPIGAGLGSSASFSVCLSAALLCAAQAVSLSFDNNDISVSLTDADKDLINRWAFNAEKISHVTPSGVDNCIATYGGALRYQGGQYNRLHGCHKMAILAVNTMVTRNTKNMVNLVAEKRKKYPDIINPILEAIDNITDTFCKNYMVGPELGDQEFLVIVKDLIEMNQNLLNALGVSHEKLEEIFTIAKKFGLSSKLTGAGGGGFAYILLPNDMQAEKLLSLKADMKKRGFFCHDVVVGGPGVQVHSGESR